MACHDRPLSCVLLLSGIWLLPPTDIICFTVTARQHESDVDTLISCTHGCLAELASYVSTFLYCLLGLPHYLPLSLRQSRVCLVCLSQPGTHAQAPHYSITPTPKHHTPQSQGVLLLLLLGREAYIHSTIRFGSIFFKHLWNDDKCCMECVCFHIWS